MTITADDATESKYRKARGNGQLHYYELPGFATIEFGETLCLSAAHCPGDQFSAVQSAA
jgi:hypothetical protein